jgi:hypothetical protein
VAVCAALRTFAVAGGNATVGFEVGTACALLLRNAKVPRLTFRKGYFSPSCFIEPVICAFTVASGVAPSVL